MTYYLYGDVDKEVEENISSAYTIGTILVDYSAQNGFGGYDRAFAAFKIYDNLLTSLDSMKLNDASIKLVKTLTSAFQWWSQTW